MEIKPRDFFSISLKEVVRLPGLVGAGLGEKESLVVYRPMVRRHKSSFLRSFRNKPNVHRLRRQVQAGETQLR